MGATDLQTAKASELDPRVKLALPTDVLRPHWYAVSTRANHEKNVADHLTARSVEYFLPLYESIRRWKDRRVRLQMPLFPGYVFVRIRLRDRLPVLQIPSVATLVSFDGMPSALPDAEIAALKAGLEHGVQAVPHPYLNVGKRVRITTGPLEGLEGIVIRKKNALRFVISLDMIQRSVVVELDQADLGPLPPATRRT